MKILNELTLKNLKLNKKRTIVTILGIVLSVALICAITTFVSSFQNALVSRAKTVDGNFHILLSNFTREELEENISASKIDKFMYAQEIGYAKLEGCKNVNKPYLYIQAADKNYLENMGIILLEGRLPENEREMIIPEHIKTNGGVSLKVGDVISLEIGNRYKDNERLGQKNPYETKEDIEDRIRITKVEEDISLEHLEIEDRQNYKIVGIMHRSNLEPYSAPGYMVYTKLENMHTEKNMETALLLKDPSQAYKQYQEIENTIKEDQSIGVNSELLRFEGVMKQDRTNIVLYVIAGVVIGIIVITSIFVIRNSFAISIAERLKEYGMLASIGATSKQIKRNVLFEAILLASISIPIGVITGILAITITLMIVNPLIQSAHLFDYFELNVSISWLAIFVTIVVSIITVLLSALTPAKKVSKISPMEAIRENSQIKVNYKRLHTWKLTQKLLGIEGEIASKNLKRSRKKYRTTIFSIFLSVVLFISISSIITYGFKLTQLEYQEMDYNIRVRLSSTQKELDEQLTYYNHIGQLETVKEFAIVKNQFATISKEYLSEDTKQYNYYLDEESSKVDIALIAVGKQAYEEFVRELGLNLEQVKSKGILVDKQISVQEVEGERKRIEYRALNLEKSDVLEYQVYLENNQLEDRHISIATITSKLPMYIPMQSEIATIIVSDEMIQKDSYRLDGIYLNSEDSMKTEEQIKKIDDIEEPIIYNYEEKQNENNSMVLIISIFLYGFIIVISLIGITNIFNTITTNMMLRSKEFAILKSIGMKDKEFRKMIRYESILYATKALLFGIPVGVLLSYFIYKILGSIYLTDYIFPIKEILICIFFVFCIIFITMRYAIKKVEKQNIIETIRQENI